jgi:flagellar protein FliT
MENQNSIAIYEAIAELTNRMLIAAKEQDWDMLTELENRSAQLVDKLKYFKDLEPLSGNATQQKVSTIKRILVDDREIRDLVSPRMARLSAMISNSHTGKKVTRAYNQ